MAAKRKSAKPAIKRDGRKRKRVTATTNRATTKKPARKKISYALERLFEDQDEDFVIDCIAPVLAWVPGKSKAKSRQPFEFPVDQTLSGTTKQLTLALTWDVSALAKRVPGLKAHDKRLRKKRSPQREHVTELAAYGLSLVAISVLFPGRRVVGYMQGAAPDILFDLTPKALRGVEAAGRGSGGKNALLSVRAGKRPGLVARTDIAEVHLSLWCASARHGIMEQVKP